MNNKGVNIKSCIILAVILLIALFFVFYLLNTEKNNMKARPIREETTSTTIKKLNNDETTSTTIAIDNNVEISTPVNVEDVSNFASSLSDIIKDLSFFDNYSITTFYHGVEFNFNCTNYDIDKGECLEGSGLMKVDNALYPLYTYTNSNDNYLLRSDDYYILLNDDFVLLLTSNSKTSKGSARIFDRNGVSIGNLSDTLTSYIYQGELYSRLYPNIQDNKLYYYACSNNQVFIKYIDLGNYGNDQILERVEGTCY